MSDMPSTAELVRVGWDHNVDPPVPLVTTVETMGDGYASVCVKDKDESLRLLWAEIERLRSELITLPDGAYFFHEEGWTVQRDIKGRGWKVSRIDGPVASKAPAQRGQQVPGGNRDTVRVRGGRGASGEQLPGGNLAGQADHSDGGDADGTR